MPRGRPRAKPLPPLPDIPHRRATGEPVDDYQAFETWLSLGSGRTLPVLADKLGRDLDQLQRLSARWAWNHRLEFWERDTGTAFMERLAVEQARVMAAQHLDAGAKSAMAATALTLEDFEALDPKDKVAAWKIVRGEQRASAGIRDSAGPTVNVSTSVAFASLDAMTATQLVEIAEQALGDTHPAAFTALCDALLALEQSTPAQRRTVIGQLG